jgi:murein DD-endopeptidase MepM/ murein hydrolase activator NlpD
MGKQAKDYPVTFPYGATGAPYNKTYPHRGDDRIMPKGTPVVVNGVQIGLSGSTGWATGPHLHIGKWAGVAYNPRGLGFSFQNAKVTQVDTLDNDANGRYVRVQADGYSWVYLHLSAVTCKVGQVLKVRAPLPIPIIRKFHTVVAGDTVTAICRKYGISISRFQQLNPNIKNINWIYVGQKVRVK